MDLINHNRMSSERRCAFGPRPRCTALSHCDRMYAPESIKGFNHVSWHLASGRLQDGDFGYPERASAANVRARCPGVCSPSLTTWPKSAARCLLTMSLTCGRPVVSATVVLRTLSLHTTPRIRRWHRKWNACCLLVSVDSKVHVSYP